MSSLAIVKGKIHFEADLNRGQGLIILEINVLILDRAPQSLDENVIRRATSTIHADPQRVGLQGVDEVMAGELSALIGVENLRDPKPTHRLLETVHAESRIQRIAEPPGEHLATIPVHNGDQVPKPMSEPDVGDIGTPGLIGPLDRQPPQQVGIHQVGRMGLTGVRARNHPRQPQLLHQALHPFPIDREPALSQKPNHPPTAEKRVAGVFFINQPEHPLFRLGHRFDPLPGVIRGATDPRHGALPDQGQGVLG